MTPKLRPLQEAIVQRLATSEPLSIRNIPVYSRLDKEIESLIDQALANIGLTVFVFPPEPRTSKPNIPGPEFDLVRLRVRILENPILSSSEFDIWDVWEIIASQPHGLHFWRPGNFEWCSHFFIASDPFEDQTLPDDGARVFDCLFENRLNLNLGK